jgi:predicted PurR-regulated permease PerM
MPNAPTGPGRLSSSRSLGDSVTPRELDIVKVAAALVSGGVLLAGLYYGRQILIPLAIAFLISVALNPPVTWLARLGLP